MDVANLLNVNLTDEFIDANIETDIENAFRRSSIIDEDKINVRVTDGIATLTGIITTYQIKRLARGSFRIDFSSHTGIETNSEIRILKFIALAPTPQVILTKTFHKQFYPAFTANFNDQRRNTIISISGSHRRVQFKVRHANAILKK